MKTHLIFKIVPSLCLVVAGLSACGGGGGSSTETAAAPAPAASPAPATSSTSPSGKTPTELSAEVTAQLTAVSTISPTMDWSSNSLATVVAGQVNVASGSSLGKADILVSTVDFMDPTTGSTQETGMRGTTLYDSRIDDPSRAASTIDSNGLNAQFSLNGVNFREIDKLYIEVFSTTKGLVYSAVVSASDVKKKTYAITVD